ncbi:MAG: TatD family hydrolase [Pseudomonadota bacterium]
MTDDIHLVDSHCHLDFPDFDNIHDKVVAQAAEFGVKRMVTICTKLRSLPQVKAIAEANEAVFFAAGTHPMNVAEEGIVEVGDLLEITSHHKMVAIGESGLDYHYTSESAEVQKKSLRIHIEAARQSGLPLIIHARAADDDIASILTEEYKNGAYSCVMHCFSSGAELARKALDLGFYLSMSGIVTFPKSQELRDIFASAPLDRILVETDSPYLAPVPYRGRRNEPAHVHHTAKTGADLFGLTLSEFASITTDNFDRLFTKAAVGKPL